MFVTSCIITVGTDVVSVTQLAAKLEPAKVPRHMPEAKLICRGGE